MAIDLFDSDKVARSIVDVGCVGAAQVAREPTQHLLFSDEGRGAECHRLYKADMVHAAV